jgi:hypothetical protein
VARFRRSTDPIEPDRPFPEATVEQLQHQLLTLQRQRGIVPMPFIT